MFTEDNSGVKWRKSSKSATTNCVEVAAADDSVFVRDSKNRGGEVLSFEPAVWSAFIMAIQREAGLRG
jgi:hypothetical protein